MAVATQNDYYQIEFREDGVYFLITNFSSRIKIEDVITRVMRKKIKEFNKKSIETALMKNSTDAVKFAPAQREEPIDAVASVVVSDDKMKGFLTIYPPEGGKNLSRDALKMQLFANGVKFGVKEDVLNSLATNPVFNKPILVAEGKEMKNGTNGRLEFKFDINKIKRPTIREDGTVDHKELNLIRSVSEGEVLCNALPPTPGISGVDVTGKEIKAKDGKPAILPKGKNVEVTEDNKCLFSKINGSVQYIENKISVFSTVEIRENVDTTTGNIYFIGNVYVKGMVTDGFVVEAQGNIEVEGIVEGATLIAGGDIILHRGMSGKAKGKLLSGNDIVAKFIENSSVQARNNIVSDVIMHSTVKCGEKLTLQGRKGLLVGGLIMVGSEIEAKIIGSHMATTTEIEVGVDPGARERLIKLKEEIANRESDFDKINKVITYLNKMRTMAPLTKEKEEILEKSNNTIKEVADSLQELKDEYEENERKMREDEDKGTIKVGAGIYPGTRIAIRTANYTVKDVLKAGIFRKVGEDIKFGK